MFEGVNPGLNSEALIPVLLLHTPNLQSFDMGDARLDIMGSYVSCGEAERIYDYCTVDNPEHRLRRGTRAPEYPGFWQFSLPQENYTKNYYSFLYLHMRLDSGWLPGLSNITHFSHGCYRAGGYFDRWPASHLFLMMLLPRLQTAQFYGATVIPADSNAPLKLTMDRKFSGEKSTIKHLELLNCRFRRADYEAIAQMTGSLESFRCILEHEEVPWDDFAYETDVHDVFRLHNRNTLKEEHTSVSRATGDDKDPKDMEQDMDYGDDDDDFFYRSDDPHYHSEVDDSENDDDDDWGFDELEGWTDNAVFSQVGDAVAGYFDILNSVNIRTN
ncbi:hypothetical protein TWF281_000795 [Arthrobotrys megalospora]